MCTVAVPQVMHIKKQPVIGVGAEGVDSFQHGRLSWLQVRSAVKHTQLHEVPPDRPAAFLYKTVTLALFVDRH